MLAPATSRPYADTVKAKGQAPVRTSFSCEVHLLEGPQEVPHLLQFLSKSCPTTTLEGVAR